MAMRGGSHLDRPGLLDEGEERRVHAGRAIRGSFQRALPAHRLPDSQVLVRSHGILSAKRQGTAPLIILVSLRERVALSPLGVCVTTHVGYVESTSCKDALIRKWLIPRSRFELSHRLPWGRGWPAAGVFFSRSGPGEGVAGGAPMHRGAPRTRGTPAPPANSGPLQKSETTWDALEGRRVCFSDAARLMIPIWLEHENSK